MDAPSSTGRPRVYGANPMMYLYVVGMAGLAVGMTFWFMRGEAEAALLDGTVGAVALLFVGAFVLVYRRHRLEVSLTGIRMRVGGSMVQTSWQNIAGFRLDEPLEGFITREPVAGEGMHRLWHWHDAEEYDDAQVQTLLRERRFLPLRNFIWHLRHGDLAENVERFAPHLRLRETLEA